MNLLIQESSDKALALMERVLRGGAPLAAEYPLIFGEHSPGHLVTVEVDGQVCSTCACLARELVLPGLPVSHGSELPFGLIGSVATDPVFEGRGFASSVLAVAEQELRNQGSLLALLWADDPDFYLGRGYTFVGAERDYLLEPEMLSRLPDLVGIRPATADDSRAIHELNELSPLRVRRSVHETCELLAVPGMETLVLETANGIEAYACVGRGGDLKGVVHEWSGSADQLLGLFREHWLRRAERGESGPLFLMTPTTASDLHARLDDLGAGSALGVLGMAKLLDLDRSLELLREALAPQGVRVTLEPEGFALETDAGRYSLCDDELIELLFAERGERSLHERVEQTLKSELTGLPWTPFVWGLDSI